MPPKNPEPQVNHPGKDHQWESVPGFKSMVCVVDGCTARRGPGRTKGQKNRSTIEAEMVAKERLEAAKAAGITPLEFMLSVMREEPEPKKPEEEPAEYMARIIHLREVRMDAAKAAAPYCHPKLANIEVSGNVAISHEDALDDLE